MEKEQLEKWKQIVNQIIEASRFCHLRKILEQKYPQIFAYIDFNYPQLDGHKFQEKLFWFMNDISDFGICPICKSKKLESFKNYVLGYSPTCSTKCGNHLHTYQHSQYQYEVPSLILDRKYRDQVKELHIDFSKTSDYPKTIATKIPMAFNYIYFKEPKLIGHEFAEKLYWFLNGLIEFPICPICQKTRPGFKNVVLGYSPFCSSACAWKDEHTKLAYENAIQKKIDEDPFYFQNQTKKTIQTKQEKYGDPHWNNSEQAKQTRLNHFGQYQPLDFKEKVKNTLLNDHGDPNWNNSEKHQQTCLENYGVLSYSQTEEFLEKCKKTNQSHLGVDWPAQHPQTIEKMSASCRKNFGVDFYPQSKEHKALYKDEIFVKNRQEKIYKTKRENGTFTTSKPEEIAYDLLCSKFGDENVIRQYSSDVYPFNCDFYIKGIDLYIELNAYWTHGNHFFDVNNLDDIKIVETWKSKHTKFFDAAIDTWTRRDLFKAQTAIKNKLHYLVFWSFDELQSWIMEVKNGILEL